MGVAMGEQIRYISLFSGVEACSVAWHHMDNWLPQAFAEFDEFPSAVLKHQFPHIPNVGDVTKHDWKQYKGQIELIVGGSPCQSFSVAGRRLGLDDPRGNLALHFLRIVDEIRPTWFLFENVPGLLSSDDGRDFAAFLRQVEEIGYGCAYRVLDAQYFGVPQRRRRVFVVGHIDGDWRRAAAVLFEPEGLSRNPPARKTQGQGASTNARPSTSTGGTDRRRGINDILDSSPAGALTTEIYHRRGYGNQTVDTHAALIPEVADTVAAKWQKGADVQLGSQSGDNIIPVAVDLFNQLETGDVHCALRTAGGHGAPAVMVYENHGQDSRVKEIEVAPTIPAKAGTGGNNLPIVTQPVWAADLSQKAEGIGMAEEVANTVAPGTHPGHGNHVIHSFDSTFGGQSNVFDQHTPPLKVGSGLGIPSPPAVTQELAVRRLTPMECERLQGFPDGWTQIPWKGKPKERCPDGPRFKCMGNSMAVPVMRWIGEGIELVNRIPRTEAPQQEELGWL